MLRIRRYLQLLLIVCFVMSFQSLVAIADMAELQSISGQSEQDLYAFIDVNVITMEREEILPGQTVVVQGGKIVAMAPVGQEPIPLGAMRILGKNRYLLPGLVDMHVHLREEYYLNLLLANGVTMVRNMDGRPEHLLWRQQIVDGERIGPRIFTTGPIIDQLPACVPGDHHSLTQEEASAIVTAQKEVGYDFIKVYDGLSPTSYFNIIAAAQETGMQVAGHVPNRLCAIDAVLAGQRSIEHLDGYFGVYPDQLPALIAATIEHDVWNVPTLIIFQRLVPTGSLAQSPVQQTMLRYMSPSVLQSWWLPRDFGETGYDYHPVSTMNLEMVRQLYQAGAPLLLGTDAPIPCAVPGFAVHQELQNLVDAGLSPFVALQTATSNPARFLGQADRFGTVTVGKTADLLLLADNPLSDIANTQKIVGVLAQGRWFSQTELEQLLEDAALRRGE